MKTRNFVNLTPHTITFVRDNGTSLAVGASGEVARVTTKSVVVDTIDGIPVTQTEYGPIENLPDPQENTIYLVSSLVAQRCPDRTDVLVPSDFIRDEGGNIIGCKALNRVPAI